MVDKKYIILVLAVIGALFWLIALATPWYFNTESYYSISSTANTFIDGTVRANGYSYKITGSTLAQIFDATFAMSLIGFFITLVYVGFIVFILFTRKSFSMIVLLAIGTMACIFALVVFAAGYTNTTNTSFSGSDNNFSWGPSAGWFFQLFAIVVIGICATLDFIWNATLGTTNKSSNTPQTTEQKPEQSNQV